MKLVNKVDYLFPPVCMNWGTLKRMHFLGYSLKYYHRLTPRYSVNNIKGGHRSVAIDYADLFLYLCARRDGPWKLKVLLFIMKALIF